MELGFRELFLLNVLVAELEGVVSVFLVGLFLNDNTRTGFDHRYRYDLAVFIEDLRHADLFADDCLFHSISSLKVIG